MTLVIQLLLMRPRWVFLYNSFIGEADTTFFFLPLATEIEFLFPFGFYWEMALYFILYLLLSIPVVSEREGMAFSYYYSRKRRTVS